MDADKGKQCGRSCIFSDFPVSVLYVLLFRDRLLLFQGIVPDVFSHLNQPHSLCTVCKGYVRNQQRKPGTHCPLQRGCLYSAPQFPARYGKNHQKGHADCFRRRVHAYDFPCGVRYSQTAGSSLLRWIWRPVHGRRHLLRYRRQFFWLKRIFRGCLRLFKPVQPENVLPLRQYRFLLKTSEFWLLWLCKRPLVCGWNLFHHIFDTGKLGGCGAVQKSALPPFCPAGGRRIWAGLSEGSSFKWNQGLAAAPKPSADNKNPVGEFRCRLFSRSF